MLQSLGNRKMSRVISNYELNVFPDLTVKQLNEQLENVSQIKEFQLNVFDHVELKEIFQLCAQFLALQNDLNKLEIQLQTNQNLNFEHSFISFNILTQVKDLSLILSNQKLFLSGQKSTFSSSFSQFTNLLSLNLQINCSDLEGKENLFLLAQVYQNNPNLHSLIIQLQQIPEKSLIFYSFLSGIRVLSQLEVLSLSIEGTNSLSDQISDCILEELKENSNLKNFRLYSDSNSITENKKFYMIQQLLKRHPNLQKLDINLKKDSNISFYCNKDQFVFEDSLFSHSKLRNLSLNLGSFQKECFQKLVDCLSLNTQIKDIELCCEIENISSQKEDFMIFGQSLEKLSNLSSFRLSVNHKVENLKLLTPFIAELNNLDSLKSLSLYARTIKFQEEAEQVSANQQNQPLTFCTLQAIRKRVFFGQNRLFQYMLGNLLENIEISDDILQNTATPHRLNYDYLWISNTKVINPLILHSQLVNKYANKSTIKIININCNEIIEIEKDQQQQFVQQVSQYHQLHTLRLSILNKNDYSELIRQLGLSLRKLRQLQEIKLELKRSEQVNEEGFTLFVNSLYEMQNIESFLMDFNTDNQRAETLNKFASSFSHMEKLQNLSISISNQTLTDPNTQKILANGFILPKKIQNLSLSFNIGQVKYEDFENLFMQISTLEELNFLTIKFDLLKLNFKQSVQLKNHLSTLKQLLKIEMNYYSMNLLCLITLFQDIKNLQQIRFYYQYDYYRKIRVEAMKKDSCKDSNLMENISLEMKNTFLLADYENLNSFAYVFDLLNLLTHLKIHIPPFLEMNKTHSLELFKNLRKLENISDLKIKIGRSNSIGMESLNLLGEALIHMPKLQKLGLNISFKLNDIDWQQNLTLFTNLHLMKQLFDLKVYLFFDNVDSSLEQCQYDSFKNLCLSLSDLKNLKTLKIKVMGLVMDDTTILNLTQTFKHQETNLQHLQIVVQINTQEHFRQLMKGINRIKNLNSLMIRKTDFAIDQLFKLLRLVKFNFQDISDYQFLKNENSEYRSRRIRQVTMRQEQESAE